MSSEPMSNEHKNSVSLKNIWVTSIGNKVPALRAIRSAAAKAGLNGAVLWGGDVREECIGKYFVDEYWQMPSLAELSLEEVKDFCSGHGIGYIIPTRDGELPFFAEHKGSLAALGVKTMVAGREALEVCLDKLLFFNCLQGSGFPAIPTAETLEAVEAAATGRAEKTDKMETYVVKERFGSGSRALGINLTKEEAVQHARSLEHPIFQPYISGKEYSIDLYAFGPGKIKGAIVRSRDYVVNGESQITMSKKCPQLEKMCCDLAETLKISGHAIFQAIVDGEDLPHIIECNCRFGGASTLSIAMGLDSFYWFFMEGLGYDPENLPFIRSETEKKQVRYAENLIL